MWTAGYGVQWLNWWRQCCNHREHDSMLGSNKYASCASQQAHALDTKCLHLLGRYLGLSAKKELGVFLTLLLTFSECDSVLSLSGCYFGIWQQTEWWYSCSSFYQWRLRSFQSYHTLCILGMFRQQHWRFLCGSVHIFLFIKMSQSYLLST